MVALCANGREPSEGWDMAEAEESAEKLYEVWTYKIYDIVLHHECKEWIHVAYCIYMYIGFPQQPGRSFSSDFVIDRDMVGEGIVSKY